MIPPVNAVSTRMQDQMAWSRQLPADEATANRSVNNLQVLIEGTSDYSAGSSDAMRNKRIETFNFEGMLAAFDTARAANPSLTAWASTNALLAQHLSGSDTAAIGGD